jgi:prophage antirepressor-like protein
MNKEFIYEGNLPIRTVNGTEGEIWFAGIDVCNILEYANPSDIIDKTLDDDEKKLEYLIDTSGQKRKTWTINESGLYHLIITSTKPEAKKFRKWITSEVLPAIRKAGIYSTEQAQEREFELQELTKLIHNKKALLKINLSNGKDLKSEIAKLESRRDTLIQNFNPQLKLEFIQKEE